MYWQGCGSWAPHLVTSCGALWLAQITWFYFSLALAQHCDRSLPSNSASRQIVARPQWRSESGWTSQTQRRKLVTIDTLSQSVRPSPQLVESEPIRVSVASLRNMSGERT